MMLRPSLAVVVLSADIFLMVSFMEDSTSRNLVPKSCMRSITAAKNLLKAGARENKKKKSVADMQDSVFLESEPNQERITEQTDK